MKNLLILLLAAIFYSGNSFGQTKVERIFKKENYYEVIQVLKEKEKENSLNFNEIEILALSYYYNNDYSSAYLYFNKYIELQDLSSQNKFYYAHCLKAIGDEFNSNIFLKKYYSEVGKNLDTYFEDLDAVKRLGNRYKIKNEKKVNSEYSDIVSSTVDGLLYFSSSRPNKLEAEKYKWNNQPFLDNFKMKKDSSVISFSELNTDYHDGDISINKINDDIYFTSSKPDEKVYLKKEQVITTKIYRAIFENGNLKKLILLPFNSNDYSCKNPYVDYKNGRLYFSSNKAGGNGGFDIYYVDINEPIVMKNLGSDTNSSGDEDFFFLDFEKNMFFSSNGYVGFGGKDIFTRIYDKSIDSYKRVMNVGLPLNSKYDDFAYKVSENKKGFFSSNRKTTEALGDDDIYSFIELIPLDLDKIVQTVSGTIKDVTSTLGISNAKVKFISEDGLEITTISDNQGKYEIIDLPGNKKYNIIVEADRFKNKSEPFFTTSVKYDKLLKDISLDAAECLQLFSGNIKDKNNVQILAGVNVSIFDSSNKLINIVKTDINGHYEIYAPCGKTLLFKADLNDNEDPYYAEYREYIETNNEWDKKHNKNIDLIPVDGRGLISDKNGNILIPTQPIYFAYNSTTIDTVSYEELDKVVALMKEYPKWKLIIESHSDMRGKDSYNLTLSIKRAESTKKYILEKGIEFGRIICKGFGETRPLIDCINKECSENELELNRRSEFIIK